eukprot:3660994-Ditylum_brightwellii.AAC.1
MGSMVELTVPHSENRIWRLDGKDSSAKYNSPVSWSVSTDEERGSSDDTKDFTSPPLPSARMCSS